MRQEPTRMPESLTIVIPAYNESRRLGATLGRLDAFGADRGGDYDLIVVDDGSTDATADLVRARLRDGIELQLLVNAENRGKGYSVRRGILESRGDLVLLCDADLSCPIKEIDKLLPWLERGYEIAIASRDMPESVLDPPQPIARRAMAWVFRLLRRRLLLPGIRDTQCGFKLFRGDTARRISERLTIDGWLFDCEMLAVAERLGYRVREVGVTWQDDRDSRVRPLREPFRALADLSRIRRRLAEMKP